MNMHYIQPLVRQRQQPLEWLKRRSIAKPTRLGLLRVGLFFQIGAGLTSVVVFPAMHSMLAAGASLPFISALMAVVGFGLSIVTEIINILRGEWGRKI